jgi:hypothetical protein
MPPSSDIDRFGAYLPFGTLLLRPPPDGLPVSLGLFAGYTGWLDAFISIS